MVRGYGGPGRKIGYCTGMATEWVESIPVAVTFVAASKVPKDLKILKIDGHLPGEKGYPLR